MRDIQGTKVVVYDLFFPYLTILGLEMAVKIFGLFFTFWKLSVFKIVQLKDVAFRTATNDYFDSRLVRLLLLIIFI